MINKFFFIGAPVGSCLAGSSPSRPVQDVVEGVLDGAGDAVEQSADFVECQRDQVLIAGR